MPTPFILTNLQEARLDEAIKGEKKPDILLFRILGPQLQSMFSEIIDLDGVPSILLHGNPHLDNYARTYNGAGLVDFDRARIGPSLWDLLRALSSITFWSEEDQVRIDAEVSACFFNAYIRALEDRLVYWEPPDFLRQIRPKKYQMTAERYIKSGKKWVKKLQRNQVEPDEPFYAELFQAYCQTLPEETLKHWKLKEVAEVPGSMGKRHYVYHLKSLIKTRTPILLDIKETYIEEDNEIFHNPFEHQGERMVTASRLYSPGLEERIGFCSYHGEQYWVRQIPTFSAKIPVGIKQDEALQLAQAIGTQLGRGHRVVDEVYHHGTQTTRLIEVVNEYRDEMIRVGSLMNQEVLQFFRNYTAD